MFAAVVSNFEPVIVTEVPTGPLVGEKLEIVGAVDGAAVIVSMSVDVAVNPFTVTLMVSLPTAALVGTVTVKEVSVAAFGVA